MPKRPRYSRWRRLPPVFRSGEQKWADPSRDEQRLSLYVAGSLFDLAEAQASRSGAGSVQAYCTELLRNAIEAEQVREQVAELEAKRGMLEGFREIANDPEYLAEWSARAAPRDRSPRDPAARGEAAGPPPPSAIEVVMRGATTSLGERTPSDARDAAEQVVLRHAAQAGDDPSGFLACLRRGEPAPVGGVAELAQALRVLEESYRDAPLIARRAAYALHRLAFESQVLHTDAWPGSFDEWTVETLRAVQELVDRILSGQDIRYYPPATSPEDAI